jgi:hypothetical protein
MHNKLINFFDSMYINKKLPGIEEFAVIRKSFCTSPCIFREPVFA